jgi:hypothetical protein
MVNNDAQQPRVAMWIMTAPAGPPPPSPGDWTNTGRITCRTVAQANNPIVITAAQFRRLPIPAAEIVVQPDPGSRPTLVNVETNLLTVRTVQLLRTTVLGQPVQVRATPSTYHWDYGDGARRVTTNPGGRYPVMPTAHVYRTAGVFTVGLSTAFSGEYSVAGGPWLPIDGTASVPSPTVRIEAVEARTHLVS